MEGDQFGDVQPQISSIKMPLRHAGQYADDESGLFYNYYRFYDPKTGRYLRSDPIGLEGGLNTFGYVGGSPLHWIDPEGLNTTAINLAPTAIGICTGSAGTGCTIVAGSAVGIGSYLITDEYINPWLQPVIAKAVDGCVENWDAFEKQMDYDNYHRTCDRKPPSNLSPCEKARWQRRQRQSCYNKRKAWEEKWGNSSTKKKHEDALLRVKASIKNAVDDILKYCPPTN